MGEVRSGRLAPKLDDEEAAAQTDLNFYDLAVDFEFAGRGRFVVAAVVVGRYGNWYYHLAIFENYDYCSN